VSIRSVSCARRRSDYEKLLALQARLPDVLTVSSEQADAPQHISLRIAIPTAVDETFPRRSQAVSRVHITLGENYPFPPGPTVEFKTPIFNPNVFESGSWCYGWWQISENLELFVMRLLKVIALEPQIVNPKSPANSDAAEWYSRARAANPTMFPTMSLGAAAAAPRPPAMQWRNIR